MFSVWVFWLKFFCPHTTNTFGVHFIYSFLLHFSIPYYLVPLRSLYPFTPFYLFSNYNINLGFVFRSISFWPRINLSILNVICDYYIHGIQKYDVFFVDVIIKYWFGDILVVFTDKSKTKARLLRNYRVHPTPDDGRPSGGDDIDRPVSVKRWGETVPWTPTSSRTTTARPYDRQSELKKTRGVLVQSRYYYSNKNRQKTVSFLTRY